MAIHAVIKDGKVVNRIVIDDNEDPNSDLMKYLNAKYDSVLPLTKEQRCDIGSAYDEKAQTFTPDADKLKERMQLAKVKAIIAKADVSSDDAIKNLLQAQAIDSGNVSDAEKKKILDDIAPVASVVVEPIPIEPVKP